MSTRSTESRIDSITDASQVARALEEYLASVDRGEPIPRDEFLEKHASLAGQLSPCLESLDMLYQASLGFESPTRDREPTKTHRLGDYKLLRELGRGGMGIVYEAQQLSLDRRVAVKVLPFASLLDKRQLARFKNEARAAAMLKHPHIVSIFSTGVERAVHFYTMELIEGSSLDVVLRPRESTVLSGHVGATEGVVQPPNSEVDTSPIGALSTDYSTNRKAYYRRVAELVLQAASALTYAHDRGVIHRDIKPSNLLLDETGQLHVADFGLAYVRSDDKLTVSGDVVGTLRYISPEQLDGQIADERSDIYSLGITLCELLTLRPAYNSRPNRADLIRCILESEPRRPRSVDRQIPYDLENIILKATAKLPAERYTTMQAFVDDVQAFLASRPIRASRPTWVQLAFKWHGRNPTVAWSAIVILALFLVVMAAAWHREATLHRIAQQENVRANSQSDALLSFVGDILDHASQMAYQVDADILADRLKPAVEVLSDLDAEHPENRRKLVLAKIHRRLALGEWGRGNDASLNIEKALTLLQDLDRREPSNAEVQQTLLRVRKVQVENDANIMRYRRCVERSTNTWAAHSPQDQAKPRNRCWHFSHHAYYLTLAERWQDALVAGRQALEAAKQLEQNEISACSLAVRSHLVPIELEFGHWSTLDRITTTMEAHCKALIKADADPIRQPLDDFWIATAQNRLAAVANAQQDPTKAVRLLETAFERANIQYKARPLFVWWSRCLASCEQHWSDALVLLHQHDQAAEMLRSAIQRWEELGNEPDRWEAARLRLRLAVLLSVRGDSAAFMELERAMELFDDFYSTHWDEPLFGRPLLASLIFPHMTKTIDADRVVQITSRCPDPTGLMLRYVALAHYRTGNRIAARDESLRSIQVRQGGDAIDWLIASMACHNVGEHESAIQHYEKAVKAIDENRTVVFGEYGPAVVDLLREEACSLLQEHLPIN